MTVATTETPKQFRYKVRVGDEEVEMILDTCGYCKLPIYPQAPHNSCIREVRSELASEMERRRREECMIQFNEILTPSEQQCRLYPDSKVFGYSETYNQRLARIKREKEEAHYKKLADRTDRRERQLPDLERKLQSLKAQVARDLEEETQEQKQ
jgi:hypothetical protein